MELVEDEAAVLEGTNQDDFARMLELMIDPTKRSIWQRRNTPLDRPNLDGKDNRGGATRELAYAFNDPQWFSRLHNQAVFSSREGDAVIKKPRHGCEIFFPHLNGINPSNIQRPFRSDVAFVSIYNNVKQILSLIKSSMDRSGYQEGSDAAFEWNRYTNCHPIWTKYAFIIFDGNKGIKKLIETIENLGKLLPSHLESDTGMGEANQFTGAKRKNVESERRQERRLKARSRDGSNTPIIGNKADPIVVDDSPISSTNPAQIVPVTVPSVDDSIHQQTLHLQTMANFEFLMKYGSSDDKERCLAQVRTAAFPSVQAPPTTPSMAPCSNYVRSYQGDPGSEYPVDDNDLSSCEECGTEIEVFFHNKMCSNGDCTNKYYSECGDKLKHPTSQSKDQYICCNCRTR